MAGNYSEIGINFNAISNLTAPDFNLTNKTTAELINSLPQNANAMTYDYYGIIILVVLGIFLMWLFSDRTQYGEFQYNNTRSMGISMGIMLTMGIIMVSVNYMTNIIHLGIILGIYLLILLYTVINNPN